MRRPEIKIGWRLSSISDGAAEHPCPLPDEGWDSVILTDGAAHPDVGSAREEMIGSGQPDLLFHETAPRL